MGSFVDCVSGVGVGGSFVDCVSGVGVGGSFVSPGDVFLTLVLWTQMYLQSLPSLHCQAGCSSPGKGGRGEYLNCSEFPRHRVCTKPGSEGVNIWSATADCNGPMYVLGFVVCDVLGFVVCDVLGFVVCV